MVPELSFPLRRNFTQTESSAMAAGEGRASGGVSGGNCMRSLLRVTYGGFPEAELRAEWGAGGAIEKRGGF